MGAMDTSIEWTGQAQIHTLDSENIHTFPTLTLAHIEFVLSATRNKIKAPGNVRRGSLCTSAGNTPGELIVSVCACGPLVPDSCIQ